MNDPRELKAQLEEKARRQATASKPIDLATCLFSKQAEFVTDPAKRKAALCTRRAGKSYGCAIYLIQEAIKHRGERLVYITYTRQKAKELMEKPLSELLRAHKIHFEFNKADLRFQLENGSEIILRGANKPEEIDKLRGDHFPLVIIDECGHGAFNKYLDVMVNEVVEGCVAQHDGTIVLLGTPGNYVHNLFFEVTTKQEPGWSVAAWTWEDNPYVRESVGKTVQRKLDLNPLWANTDGYKREWQGQWAIDEDALCYHITDRNLIEKAPNPSGFRFLLGCDLGWNDATAFTVMGYHPNDPTLYIFESHKSSYLDVTATVAFVRNLEKRYRFSLYVIDGQSKQTVEEMKQRHRIPWISTLKSPNYKFDAIKRMNADFVTQSIKLVAGTNQELIKEYRHLVWDEVNPTKEKDKCPNHLADATLYAWLKSLHYNGKVLDPESLRDPEQRTHYNPPDDTESMMDWIDAY